MKCMKCKMYPAIVRSHIEGVTKNYCRECYKRILNKHFKLATGKELSEIDTSRCMDCGAKKTIIIAANGEAHRSNISIGYNHLVNLGVYCKNCMWRPISFEPVGSKKRESVKNGTKK